MAVGTIVLLEPTEKDELAVQVDSCNNSTRQRKPPSDSNGELEKSPSNAWPRRRIALVLAAALLGLLLIIVLVFIIPIVLRYRSSH